MCYAISNSTKYTKFHRSQAREKYRQELERVSSSKFNCLVYDVTKLLLIENL